MTLFLDLDDTLVASSKAYDAGMKSLGIDPSDENFLTARSQVKSILPPSCVQSHNRFLYFKKYLENLNLYTSKRLLDMMNSYEKGMLDSIEENWHSLKRDALFKELRQRFNKIVLITNETTRTQVLKVNRLDPKGIHFDYMLTSEEAGVEKPDLKIFHLAQKIFNTEPQQCCMVGDSFKNDILPAISLNFNTVILTREFLKTSEMNGDKKFQEVDSLNQILNFF
jgi:HAD superfamily hydrolase (TIGR01509 family)